MRLRVPSLTFEDTEVVARASIRWSTKRTAIDYRMYDGVLWQPTGRIPIYRDDAERWECCRVEELVELVTFLQQYSPEHVRESLPTIAPDLRSVFQFSGRMPLFPFAGIRPIEDIQEEDAAALRDSAKEPERQVVVIDGELWKRSEGPLVQGGWKNSSSGLALHGSDEDSWNLDPVRRATRFAWLDFEHTKPYIEEVFGKALFQDTRFERCGDAPRQERAENAAVEMALWFFLWKAKWQGSEHSAMARAVIEARRAISRRWESTDLDLFPTHHEAIAPHFHGCIDLPPVDDLLPVLETVIAATDGVLPSNEVKIFRLALLRGQELVKRLDSTRVLGDLRF